MADTPRRKPRKYLTLSQVHVTRVAREYPPRSLSALCDRLLALHFLEKDKLAETAAAKDNQNP